MGTGKKVFLVINALLVFLVLMIGLCSANHQMKLKNEEIDYKTPGSIVKVDGHYMSIYSEGHGDTTLVFMAGGGTSSPILDFKSLYSILSDKYKIVVVERFGYGFSDIVNTSRDVDTVLEETRSGLQKAGIIGPYVLMPHSMAGIEALYWAQKHPSEVKAIVGLDMAVPDTYNNYKPNRLLLDIGHIAAATGATRIISSVSESDAIKYGSLSKKDKDLYRVIFYRRTATVTMMNETYELKNNATLVGEKAVPDVPILLFSSDGTGTGWKAKDWKGFQRTYMSRVRAGKIIDLDCSHYVQNRKYQKIARETDSFLEDINSK